MSADAAAVASAAPLRDGLPQRYSNLNQLQADAEPLLTAAVRCWGGPGLNWGAQIFGLHLRRHSASPQQQAYGYYASGSDNEWTLGENAEALGRYRLLPRVLVDVSTVDISTSLLGERSRPSAPLLDTALGHCPDANAEHLACLLSASHPCRPAPGGAHHLCTHGPAAAVPPGRRAGHGSGGGRRRPALHPVHHGHQQHRRGGRGGGGAGAL